MTASYGVLACFFSGRSTPAWSPTEICVSERSRAYQRRRGLLPDMRWNSVKDAHCVALLADITRTAWRAKCHRELDVERPPTPIFTGVSEDVDMS